MIQLTPAQHEIVDAILRQHPYKFFVFGSRAKGCAKDYSDLDLAYDANIPLSDLATIETAFNESDLPFSIDLIDLNIISAEFLANIQPDLTPYPQI
jgi:predicted nucleotidyltransferase